MKLIVKAKHFKGASYESVCGCPLATAEKSQFKTDDASEGVNDILIGDVNYSHKLYEHSDYLKDYDKAKKLRFSNAVVNVFRLTKEL
jgi:hypothetical protein